MGEKESGKQLATEAQRHRDNKRMDRRVAGLAYRSSSVSARLLQNRVKRLGSNNSLQLFLNSLCLCASVADLTIPKFAIRNPKHRDTETIREWIGELLCWPTDQVQSARDCFRIE